MANIDHNSLKTIDLELGMKLTNGRKELALEMLAALKKALPEDYQAVQAAYESQDTKGLLIAVHHLNSGTCYCGVPRLRQATHELHQALKEQNSAHVAKLYQQLTHAVQDFMQAPIPV